jgi:hypothetical protein
MQLRSQVHYLVFLDVPLLVAAPAAAEGGVAIPGFGLESHVATAALRIGRDGAEGLGLGGVAGGPAQVC